MKHIILGAAALSLLITACASSGPPRGDRPEQGERSARKGGGERGGGPMTSVAMGGIWLAGLDQNNDYAVSQAEFTQGKQAAFSSADVNNDESLSLFELDDWRIKALGSVDASPGRFTFDPDFDQQISKAEFETTLDYLFTRSDKDKDGLLYRSEIIRIIDRSIQGRGGQGAGQGGGQRGGQRGGRRGEGGGRGQGGGRRGG